MLSFYIKTEKNSRKRGREKWEEKIIISIIELNISCKGQTTKKKNENHQFSCNLFNTEKKNEQE